MFVFTTATWWDTHANFRKVATAYGAVSPGAPFSQFCSDDTESIQPVVLTAFYLLLKMFTRQGFVRLSNDEADFQRAIETLKEPKIAHASRRPNVTQSNELLETGQTNVERQDRMSAPPPPPQDDVDRRSLVQNSHIPKPGTEQ